MDGINVRIVVFVSYKILKMNKSYIKKKLEVVSMLVVI